MAEKIAPYGSWKSPITTDLIVAGMVGLGGMHVDGDDIYWTELRPEEGGRMVLVRHTPDGARTDITPPPFNARTTVHEYGGKAYTVREGQVYFSNYADQRVYALRPGEAPQPVTPAAPLRYADLQVDSPRGRIVAVREDHRSAGQEATNTLVSLPLPEGGEGQVLVSGNNFYAYPRLNPDGAHLAWLTWNHPNMPWDGCELWVGDLDASGAIRNATLVAGGVDESIGQPAWDPQSGALYFVSDRTGWWNLYRWQDGGVEALYPMQAEFGVPQWAFGQQTYTFLPDDRLLCSYIQNGQHHLGILHVGERRLEPLDLPFTYFDNLHALPGEAVFIAASAHQFPTVALLHLDSLEVETLRAASTVHVAEGYLSTPQETEFPTENGLVAHALYYPPHNRDFRAPEGERPPLLVKSHGGPTSAVYPILNLGTQYWTSRGFAVLDVNYGGSTGYGRAYRQRLNGQWGVVDVDDCTNGALYLAEQGLVDGERLAITGGSAGGYTTLCALTFRDVFKAGASHFGIGDLEPFTTDTHKFESHYNDRLVGPYPERKDVYYQRSPIHFVDQIKVPLFITQGLDDPVVPPAQAETMFAAVKAKGLPVGYLPFAGEQHGYRRAETIKRSLEAEFYFYSRVFGFEPADEIDPVTIENLD